MISAVFQGDANTGGTPLEIVHCEITNVEI
jgi:hypothetical protein